MDWRRHLRRNRSLVSAELGAIVVVETFIMALFVASRAQTTFPTSVLTWLRQLALAAPLVPVFFRARSARSMRGAWYLVGAGMLLYNGASILELPTFAAWPHLATARVHDVALISSTAALAAGIAIMAQRSFGPRATSVRLDGFIAGLALASWASASWLRNDIGVNGRPLIAEINIFNPVLVMALLVLLVSGLVPRHFRTDTTTSWIMVGLSAFAAGDLLQLNGVNAVASISTVLIGASRPIGLLALALAAWPRDERRAESRETVGAPKGLNLVPVIFGTVSIAILTLGVLRPLSQSTRFMALGALLLVIVRMVMTQGEARQLGRSSFVEARTDHVTGLANRRAFLEDGEALLAGLQETERLAIALIDLDGFKEVNDSIGHAYGDELLKVIGKRFLHVTAERGSLARLGGDEFAYTFVVDDTVDPVAAATKLSQALVSPVSLDGTKVRVSASIGVATWPQHGATHSELLRSADVAMYEAKRNHSDVCVYRDEIDLNSRERLSMINELRNAIDRRRLTLHFQPTRDLRTGGIYGVEALVRWQHPELGLLQPDSFIPLAERVGLIAPLTRAVLDLAITELARLGRDGHDLRMSVNISQWDLIDPQLPDSIHRILEWYKIPAERITLEVTESSLSRDPAMAKRSLERLRSSGVRVAIDDFGVGYSSMSQLLELPVDELKIDRSFVVALGTDTRAISLVRSIIEMARALGLTVVAEGIEEARILETLQIVGADVIQGDYVSPALTSGELDQFLASETVTTLPAGHDGEAPTTARATHLHVVR
ncbi:MAG: bifunctional diguanylate cyclase/phosphodiesterase [Acidobacteriota bacterium]|nr:bifunctional diguanylate cyclase/phosphodiesterase [Acidobacteriota bacterium]